MVALVPVEYRDGLTEADLTEAQAEAVAVLGAQWYALSFTRPVSYGLTMLRGSRDLTPDANLAVAVYGDGSMYTRLSRNVHVKQGEVVPLTDLTAIMSRALGSADIMVSDGLKGVRRDQVRRARRKVKATE